MRLGLVFAVLATPAFANVEEAVEHYILPAVDRFAEAAAALAEAAEADCTADALRPSYLAALDAWAPIADIRIGPAEAGALTIAYWPDERGAGMKTLRGLIAKEDIVGQDPAAYAAVSAAARGFPALDLLLGDPELSTYASGSYACDLVRTVTADLAKQAEQISDGWDVEATALTTAGGPDNASYLSEDEAFQALYTQILSSLEFSADSRLGRPLGEPDRPRPARAEFWRSGRPLLNAQASAEGAVRLAGLLSGGPLVASEAALDQVRRAAAVIDDPSFQDIEDPSARLKLEILQQRVRALLDALEVEVGSPRGLQPGFNSRDGD